MRRTCAVLVMLMELSADGASNADLHTSITALMWIKFKPDYNSYLYEGVDKIGDMSKCSITELIDKFDTAKYFKVCCED